MIKKILNWFKEPEPENGYKIQYGPGYTYIKVTDEAKYKAYLNRQLRFTRPK